MNTNMTGFRWFSKMFALLNLNVNLDESWLSLGRVNIVWVCSYNYSELAPCGCDDNTHICHILALGNNNKTYTNKLTY